MIVPVRKWVWVLWLPDSGRENHCVSGQDHVFLGLGILIVLRQRQEDNMIISLLFLLVQVNPQAIWYGERQKEK